MKRVDLHIAWARLFLRAVTSAGVRDLVLSPGSRSTPLALAAAETPELRVHVVVDERAAAFFALGQARVTRRPSLLVCTSGSAGAHYLPALIEAHQSHIPMIALTADRPWELIDAAAPQTIDQSKLFGDFVRWYVDLGLPDPAPSALRAVPRIAAQAAHRATSPLAGPVHINMHFRKPLEPSPQRAESPPEPWQPLWQTLMERGSTSAHPPTLAPDERAVAAIAERAAHAERGLIVCGPLALLGADERAAILDLAAATGFPLCAEATSQLRFGGRSEGLARCSSFDAIFRSRAFRAQNAPDFILEIGAPPTSAGYAALLAEHPNAPRFVVAPHGWNDPSATAAALVFADPPELARRVRARLPAAKAPSAWTAAFLRADALARRATERALEDQALTEGAVARELIDACPEGSLLCVGNSTPVRDLDTFCQASSRALSVLHQRGASGIDGLVAGTAGASRAAPDTPVTLFVGDLSFVHDLTSLQLFSQASAPVVIVVVQNGGGRIFEQLPVAERVERALFERLFLTPVPVAFEHAARAFGVAYARVDTRLALASTLAEAYARSGPTLIEAIVAPGEGPKRLRTLWAETARELGETI